MDQLHNQGQNLRLNQPTKNMLHLLNRLLNLIYAAPDGFAPVGWSGPVISGPERSGSVGSSESKSEYKYKSRS